MESSLLEVADYACQQPGVTGYLCVDKNGLCLAAKGDVDQSMSGVVHQIASLASKIDEICRHDRHDSMNGGERELPVVRVDLDRHKITIQSRDSVTTALISPQK